MLPPTLGRSGAKRMIEQLEPQQMPVERQAVDFQSLSAAAAPVQRSLGAINISLEEYRFLSDKLPQFRAQKALRAREAQTPPGPGLPLEMDTTAIASGMAQWRQRLAHQPLWWSRIIPKSNGWTLNLR